MVVLTGLGVHTLDGGDIQRGGHVRHNGVEQLLYTLVLIGGAAGHGNHAHTDGALAQGTLDHLFGDLFALEIAHHDLLVLFGHGVHELFTVLVGEIHHIGGDLLFAHVLAEIIIEDKGLHLDEVDHALEGGLCADG